MKIDVFENTIKVESLESLLKEEKVPKLETRKADPRCTWIVNQAKHNFLRKSRLPKST